MYGIIARLHLKPGAEADLHRLNRETALEVPGLVFEYAYRTDADPDVVFLVNGFASKAAYHANAASPAQQARYDQFRALLTAEPEWHDGEIPFAYPPPDEAPARDPLPTPGPRPNRVVRASRAPPKRSQINAECPVFALITDGAALVSGSRPL